MMEVMVLNMRSCWKRLWCIQKRKDPLPGKDGNDALDHDADDEAEDETSGDTITESRGFGSCRRKV